MNVLDDSFQIVGQLGRDVEDFVQRQRRQRISSSSEKGSAEDSPEAESSAGAAAEAEKVGRVGAPAAHRQQLPGRDR